MKYMVAHSCGHDEEVCLYGNNRDRERKIQWLESIPCPACREAEAERKTQERTRELGLPDLKGTQRQTEWATVIRLSQLGEIKNLADRKAERMPVLEERLASAEDEERIERRKKALENARAYLARLVEAIDGISGIQEASWWIDHRNASADGLIDAYEEYRGIERARAVEKEAELQMVTMEPEVKQTSTVVTLTAIGDSSVAIRCDRDEHIRLTLRANGFTWDRGLTAWLKPTTEKTGPLKDLAPDTARILLEAGVAVRTSPRCVEAVKSGDYEPECYLWVGRYSKDNSKLAIDKAAGIKNYPEGRETYSGKYVLVDPALWREIREFADLNGYRITRLAEEMLRKAEETTVTVKPAPKIDEGKEDALKAILESPRDILDDLKEEEE